MSISEDNIKIIFGLKVKQLRTDKALSLSELAKLTGLSVSYLNEIEKGKKYPKTNKITAIADALGESYDKLVSLKLDKRLAPIEALLHSGILEDLPLDLFGIELNKLIEIVSNAPTKVNAVISTLIEIARKYNLSKEDFNLAVLRSYQEIHENYFESIEKQAEIFTEHYGLDVNNPPYSSNVFKEILEKEYNYVFDEKEINENEDLRSLRSLLIPRKKKNYFYINDKLGDSQKAFLYAREIGYVWLDLKERAYTSSWLKLDSFEQALNNFKASYFASAVILNRSAMIKAIEEVISKPKWDGKYVLDIMKKHTESPEMFMYRLTSILPKFFGLNNMFFLRFSYEHGSDYFEITKELQIAKLHNPYGNEVKEHYCRRWVSIGILKDLEKQATNNTYKGPVIDVQRSVYPDSDNEYFVMSMARLKRRNKNACRSVSIGVGLNAGTKRKIKFLDDKNIPIRMVGSTCESCAIQDCKERVADPIHVIKHNRTQRIEKAIEKLDEAL